MADDQVTLFRRSQIGFIFQFFNLLPTLTAAENIALPFVLDGRSKAEADARAAALLAKVGLQHRQQHLPEALSGGEIQRVAIARALAFNPPILLADEPTGNLDSQTGSAILDLLRQVNRRDGCTIVMVTHSEEAAGYSRSQDLFARWPGGTGRRKSTVRSQESGVRSLLPPSNSLLFTPYCFWRKHGI